MNKPLGLKMIAWWFVVGGILSIALVLLLSPILAKEVNLSNTDIFISTAISVLIVISGMGLLRVKKWAWFMALALESLSLAYQIISIPAVKKTLTPPQTVGMVVGLALYGVIIVYLLRQDIRALFGVTKPKAGNDAA
ncbi:MAG: hypothetical protein Q8O22_04265 [Candidatus Omnitrophota bacterium]|nr:hypothetical protein [Candidatus Omnitrophota bacterium]